MIKFFKKYHKWLSLILSVFILLFALSGIVLNHRDWFSGVDVNRKLLPQNYQYHHWDQAAVRGSVALDDQQVLVYGNIGIWSTDSTFSRYQDYNQGLPEGIDNRKVSEVFQTQKGDLYAGTLFGLYKWDTENPQWLKVELDLEEERIVDLDEKDGQLMVLSRSFLLTSTNGLHFDKHMLPAPQGYEKKAGLFKTLWVIHSGEIYGFAGKIFVDIIGLIFIFLTLTGIIYFINPFILKRRTRKNKDVSNVKKSQKWNLKWHNKIGWVTVLLLIITTLTGMFLRPPLLIAIARSQVNVIPHTLLDSENPWFDKLRRITYIEEGGYYVVGTSKGFFKADADFEHELQRFEAQAPASVMGINVFEKQEGQKLLVGSFSGLFSWDLERGMITNAITKEVVDRNRTRAAGPPIGQHVVAGYSKDFQGGELCFDFGSGAFLLHREGSFTAMPEHLKAQAMSLWNLALEFHTCRIYQAWIGDFYILLIPLSGLLIIFILVSGFIVWYKRHRKRKVKA